MILDAVTDDMFVPNLHLPLLHDRALRTTIQRKFGIQFRKARISQICFGRVYVAYFTKSDYKKFRQKLIDFTEMKSEFKQNYGTDETRRLVRGAIYVIDKRFGIVQNETI